MNCFNCKKEVSNPAIIIENNPYYQFQTAYICQECKEKYNYTQCFCCNNYVPNEKIKLYKDYHVCTDCIQYVGFCDYCSKPKYRNDLTYNSSDEKFVCRECFKIHNCYICRNCGEVYNTQHTCGYAEDPSLIKSPGYRPILKFMPEKNDNSLYLGVELEVGGATHDQVNTFVSKNQNEFFYFKSDCSIPSCGVEIVSHPGTLSFHKSEESGWEKILLRCIKHGLRGFKYKNCGVHIHVSKNILSNSDLQKIDLFVNNYDLFFRKISRRHSGYAVYNQKKPSAFCGKYFGDRFVAVNFCNNDTVEFRIFRSTLKYESIMAYLELCQSIIDFVGMNDFSNFTNYNINVLMQFVTYIHEKNYTNLIQLLTETEIIEQIDNHFELKLK